LLSYTVDRVFHRNGPVRYPDRPGFEVAGLDWFLRMGVVHARLQQQQQQARHKQAWRRKGSFQHR
jgi:hypothetical protein